MNTQSLSDCANRMATALKQVANSAGALATDDEDLLATIGATESGRLTAALKEFYELLTEFVPASSAIDHPEMTSVAAAKTLVSSALTVLVQDANRLQIMGRGFMGREKERLEKDQTGSRVLEEALRILTP